MKTRSKAARLIPSMMVAAATAVPAATAADLLTHASTPTSLSALGPSTSSSLALGGSSAAGATATPSVTSSGGSGSTTYIGTAEANPYGTVQATLVVTGNKITNVIIAAPRDDPRSAYINSNAVPILASETLQARSANVDAVSGATYTSESYISSLQAALAAAHL